ncbi:hypothetical protein H9656_09225 [Brevundimonas sp. Sa3CVA3]|uniref:Uncharacterized protein n=2 Tax=Brevundimonas guildfordensis TaxID=2762241 RepID=A0ABR8R1B8_9CAUL|nr:hypothetical protein [Brevundimonas guildfordensis]
MTDGRVSPAGSWTRTSEATAQALPDEAAFPYRIGANYLGTNNSAELAFIASFPFVTTTDQDGAMYGSVKAILAHSGVVI